jgi:UDP-N-acetyl-D-glucosamine dehydrogenase
MMKKLAVLGQGYVGLPLAISAAENGYQVLGYDTSDALIAKLNQGVSSVEDIEDERLNQVIVAGKYRASSKLEDIYGFDVFVICVPTPLNLKAKPDLSHVISATKSIVKAVKQESLVILESTVAPGTTRDVVAALLRKSASIDQHNLNLAYSPERTDPRSEQWDLKNTPKLVAGINSKSRDKAVEFYSKFVDNLVKCESLEVAETAKLLENSFRLVNISFVNEMSQYCRNLGIDINDVIGAAATKPYGFMPFYPSIGIGGHCIPVDPVYLSLAARNVKSPIKSIDLASEINKKLPKYFAAKAQEKLGRLKNKKILVIGIAYKSNVSDVRETPVKALIHELRNKGAKVFWNDELVRVWNNEESSEVSTGYDLAIIATRHSYVDLSKLGNTPILDSGSSIQ